MEGRPRATGLKAMAHEVLALLHQAPLDGVGWSGEQTEFLDKCMGMLEEWANLSLQWAGHLWIWETSRMLPVRREPGNSIAESGGRCRTNDANNQPSQRSDNSRPARHQPERIWDPNLRGTKALHMLDGPRVVTGDDQDCTATAATSGTRLNATAWECDGINTDTTCSYTLNFGSVN